MTKHHLLAVTCGAGPAADVATLIAIAHHAGWSVAVTATPSASSFLDVPAIEAATGNPPRTRFDATPDRDRQRTVHKADAVIMAPATYNSINKIAAGIADTYALTTVSELIGIATPTVIVPFVNTALAARTPYQNAVRALQEEGVRVLGPNDRWAPHNPGTGRQRQQGFPWQLAFDLAAAMAAATPTPDGPHAREPEHW